ncbi:S1 family peptidase [Yinghuangia soli]|uniref:Serine protease n=1 Tax=Yinghuangia soli TaxID=2908204 RepID=A0AA41PXR4_9ACTN|nr:serine protease [Yinghuangia soli]MCF2527673.1 serine protease [Yinghuangia soli]
MSAAHEQRSRRVDLARLAGGQVVQVWSNTEFRGTGFLVSAETVLSCAHVVVGSVPFHVRTVDGRMIPVEVARAFPARHDGGLLYPFPDLAALRLTEPLDGLGVWLDDADPAPGDEVVVHGFSATTPDTGIHPDTLRLSVVGVSGRFLRLQGDQVVGGFSGGPVLNIGTGRICGVLKASREESGSLGGWLVPLEAVRDCLPRVVERNADAHVPGTPWRNVASGVHARQVRLFGRGRSAGADGLTPAQYLSRHVLTFFPRPELEQLEQWCNSESDWLLRLLHAPGGSGKTRLATELCTRMRRSGWLAGFWNEDKENDRLEELNSALTARIPALVVVDYAQARMDDVVALTQSVAQCGPVRPRLRVLLLGRSDRPLWHALTTRLGDLLPPGSAVESLPRVIDTQGTGGEFSVTAAFTQFAKMRGRPGMIPPGALLSHAAHQDSLLGILALALDAVLTEERGGFWQPSDDPLEAVCAHELRVCQEKLTAHMPGDTEFTGPSGTERSAGLLLIATLAPGISPRKLAALLGRVHAGAFGGTRTPNLHGFVACLQELHPALGGGIAPLEPDRLAEALTRRVFASPEASGDADGYLSAVLGARPGQDDAGRVAAAVETVEALARARGCTVVGRIDHHDSYPVLDSALETAIASSPAVLLPALVTSIGVLPNAEPLARLMVPVLECCAESLLEALEPLLPDYPSSMSAVSEIVLRRLLAASGSLLDEPAQFRRLRRLSAYGLRVLDLGDVETAVDAARTAAALAGSLVERSDSYAADYAAALSRLSFLLERSGSEAEALRYSHQAIDLYDGLLEEPDGRRHTLVAAAALSRLAELRILNGQVHSATADAARSVMLCRTAPPSVRQEDTLLACLEMLAVCQQRTGALADAVASDEEAIARLRELALHQPGRYLDRLPDGLYRQASGLLMANRLRDGYIALREAAVLAASLAGWDDTRPGKRRMWMNALIKLSGEIAEFVGEQADWRERLAAAP